MLTAQSLKNMFYRQTHFRLAIFLWTECPLVVGYIWFAPGLHPLVSFNLKRISILGICLLCKVNQNTVSSNNWEIDLVWVGMADRSWSANEDALVAGYRYGWRVSGLRADFGSYMWSCILWGKQPSIAVPVYFDLILSLILPTFKSCVCVKTGTFFSQNIMDFFQNPRNLLAFRRMNLKHFCSHLYIVETVVCWKIPSLIRNHCCQFFTFTWTLI